VLWPGMLLPLPLVSDHLCILLLYRIVEHLLCPGFVQKSQPNGNGGPKIWREFSRDSSITLEVHVTGQDFNTLKASSKSSIHHVFRGESAL
jgi:hypothetical protein